MADLRRMITQEQLEERGYRHCGKGAEGSFQYCDFFMQRKVTDPDGIRYFIEFVHYPKGRFCDAAWMCHLNINEPHCTFEQHRPTDLDATENRCYEVWNLMGRPYYERYEEARLAVCDAK